MRKFHLTHPIDEPYIESFLLLVFLNLGMMRPLLMKIQVQQLTPFFTKCIRIEKTRTALNGTAINL